MQRICNINFDRQNFKDFHLNGGFYASIAIFNNYIHSVAFRNILVIFMIIYLISSLKPKNQMALTIMCPRWFEQFLGRLLNNQIMINCYFIKTLAVHDLAVSLSTRKNLVSIVSMSRVQFGSFVQNYSVIIDMTPAWCGVWRFG